MNYLVDNLVFNENASLEVGSGSRSEDGLASSSFALTGLLYVFPLWREFRFSGTSALLG